MYSLDILGLAAVETLKISVPTIWDQFRDRVDARVCDARLMSWASRLLAQARIDVITLGREHIVDAESYVILSNHQSHYDIPVAYAAFGPRVRMVAKTELFKIPVMGPAMHASGFIEVDRSNRRRALESLRAARARLQRDGTSVWIAPEGTRSTDGCLAPFKTGGFHMALSSGLRILPMAIEGTGLAHRPGEHRVHRGCRVKVTICPPVDPQDYGRKRLADLIARVRSDIAQHLPRGKPNVESPKGADQDDRLTDDAGGPRSGEL